MEKRDKLLSEAFAELLILMSESETDNVELTFRFNKCKAKFKVDLVELEKVEKK